MKQAYGRMIPTENETLTHVGPGTPMGELLRRYWQPIAISDELQDLPRRVRILGEDLVAFRDRRGRPGVLDLHCAHRGTSLEWGRVEADGLRCCYHGWLYDAEGRVIDMPCEPPGYAERRKVEQLAYPVTEFGGLVFVYMGPPDTGNRCSRCTTSTTLATGRTSCSRACASGAITRSVSSGTATGSSTSRTSSTRGTSSRCTR